jgi:hypothetical protein
VGELLLLLLLLLLHLSRLLKGRRRRVFSVEYLVVEIDAVLLTVENHGEFASGFV